MTNALSAKLSEFSFASDGFEANRYEAVARAARLREVRLVSNVYLAKPSELMAINAGNGVETRQSYSGILTDYNFFPERGIVFGSYRWTAEVRVKRSKALKLSTEYLIGYSGLKEASEEYVRLYFKKLARFTSYPYFRAQFATHVAASGLMLAPLPSLTDRVD